MKGQLVLNHQFLRRAGVCMGKIVQGVVWGSWGSLVGGTGARRSTAPLARQWSAVLRGRVPCLALLLLVSRTLRQARCLSWAVRLIADRAGPIRDPL